MKTRFSKSFKIILICFFVIIQNSIIYGAFETYPTSTANMAFGRLNLNGKGNILDIINEPSSIINFNMKGGEVTWNRPFQINELQQISVASAFIYKSWGLGFSASSFGNSIYNESMLVFSIARSVKTRLSLGVNIVHYQLKISDYETAHTPGFSASMRYNINNKWDWVTTIRNINYSKIGTSKDDLPQIITTGFLGDMHKIITLAIEWEQDLAYKGTIKFGVMVKPYKQLLFSAGYVSQPGQLTAGLSLNINKIYFEYSTIAYVDLGLFTHQLGIGLNLDQRLTDYRTTKKTTAFL